MLFESFTYTSLKKIVSRDREVELYSAADVAQHSYIVQNSISYLDLELNQGYGLDTDSESDVSYSDDDLHLFYSEDVINTREKCRKIHGNRSFLYNLHLDTSAAREASLLNTSDLSTFRKTYGKTIPLVHLYVYENFYFDTICEFIEHARKSNFDLLKIFKWLLKFNKISRLQLSHLNDSIVTCIVDLMRPELTDTEFVTECFRKLDLLEWYKYCLEPQKIGNILYHVHRTGKEPHVMLWCNRMIVRAFLTRRCEGICEVMKFQDAFKFCDDMKRALEHNIQMSCEFDGIMLRRSNIDTDWEYALTHAAGCRRKLLLVLLLWFYRSRLRIPNVSDSLRLVWDSIPDVFLNSAEVMTLVTIYKMGQHICENPENVYKFYCKVVGKVDATVQPRALKHYCRCRIRRNMWENNQWLPEGIAKTGLPRKLQFYLKLEN